MLIGCHGDHPCLHDGLGDAVIAMAIVTEVLGSVIPVTVRDI